MPRDLSSVIKCTRAMSPVITNTGNTAVVSAIVDTQNFDSTTFVGVTGSIADADVTFTVLVEDGDVSSLSDNAAVDDAYLIGVEAGTVTAGAAVSGAAPGFADDNKTFKIGYKGFKRYVRVTVTPAANSGDIYLAAIWIQGHPRSLPQTTQVTA